MIFVFGSNRAGIHGASAAAYARKHYGAELGVGEGRTGNSYALPTCDHNIHPLKLEQIAEHVERFLEYAKAHPALQFQVTRVGCGLAGYTDAQIAPLFFAAPDNIWLPSAFVRAAIHLVARR